MNMKYVKREVSLKNRYLQIVTENDEKLTKKNVKHYILINYIYNLFKIILLFCAIKSSFLEYFY